MNQPATDTVFAGSIPELYETLLVPLIFQPYADDLAARVAATAPRRVLEVAAGTGVVTRRMAALLPAGSSIVATDLNQAMLDKAAAPGGAFFFNAWDRIAENEFADTVMTALQSVFPDDPPRFMARVPHGYHELGAIADDLERGGFGAAPEMVTISARSRAVSAREPARAYCQGTPWRSEIEARDKTKLGIATDVSERFLAARFGSGPVDGKVQAHVVVVCK